MKVGTVLVAVFFAGLALAGTVFFGFRDLELPFDPRDKPVTDNSTPEINREGPQPKAVALETSHDFGIMEVGETGKYIFVIRNDGEAPLELQKGETTCKCTLSNVTDDSLQPGQSAEIELEWTPKGSEEFFQQDASILTNDPEQAIINFTVTGRVENRIELMPREGVDLGDLPEGQPQLGQAVIYSALLDEFQILGFKADAPQLTVTWEPATEEQLAQVDAKSGYMLLIELTPGVPIGPFRGQIELETDAGEDLETVFPVTGVRYGPVSFMSKPGSTWYGRSRVLNMGNFSAEQGKKAEVIMFIRGMDEDFKIDEPEVSNPAIKVTINEDKAFNQNKRRRYTIRFEVPAGAPPTAHSADDPVNVLLHTNSEELGDIKIRVEFISL